MTSSDSAKASLSPDGEAAWLRLKLHLEWLDCFDLIFLFSAHPAAVRALRERLAAIHRARVTGLEVPAPQSVAELLNELLPRLLHPPSYQQALNAPLWLDLTRPPAGVPAADWQQARLNFLARLNERREPLRRALSRPMVLVLPLAEKAQIKALAPDLWAIRRFSVETGNWLAAERAAPPPTHPPEEPAPFPLTDADQALVDEWQRLWSKRELDRGALLAAERAFNALRRSGRVKGAAEVALWMAEIARRRLGNKKRDSEALRDLSVSLDNVGKTDQALGEWEAARAAFAESLDIRRRILARVGETPEALRDLSVSLNNVGNTDQALGEWESARAALREGLEIAERLAAALPDQVDYKDLPDWFRRRLAELADAPGALSGRG